MRRKKNILLPKHKKILAGFGENLKLARLRRKLTAQQVSDRANLSRATLCSIEKGSASVAIGAYFQVMVVLGLEEDFLTLSKDDELGRKLQDARILTRKRA
ncbi:MAG: helix-turn-helix domain-containing protein, partial [Planctomycetota bacterium]